LVETVSNEVFETVSIYPQVDDVPEVEELSSA
jgi:hypothetical protein